MPCPHSTLPFQWHPSGRHPLRQTRQLPRRSASQQLQTLQPFCSPWRHKHTHTHTVCEGRRRVSLMVSWCCELARWCNAAMRTRGCTINEWGTIATRSNYSKFHWVVQEEAGVHGRCLRAAAYPLCVNLTCLQIDVSTQQTRLFSVRDVTSVVGKAFLCLTPAERFSKHNRTELWVWGRQSRATCDRLIVALLTLFSASKRWSACCLDQLEAIRWPWTP
jgi:hypothetical protein